MSTEVNPQQSVLLNRLSSLYDEYRRDQDPFLCKLRERANFVPGVGNPASPPVMFIGEAPGFRENEKRIPFVGTAGKFLDELLASIDLPREFVWITNLIKYRPPRNRDPQPREVSVSLKYLQREVNLVNPRCVATLGRFAAELVTDEPIGVVAGTVLAALGRPCVPLYHPMVGIYTPLMKPRLFEHFKTLRQFL